MIDNCISLIRKKKEDSAREEVFRRYMADSFKTMIESYHSAHQHTLELPIYRDFDSLIKEKTEKKHDEKANDIKSRIFRKLRKAENKR